MTVVPFSFAGGLPFGPLRPFGRATAPGRPSGWRRSIRHAGAEAESAARSLIRPMTGRSDESLVSAYRDGDRSAFRELIGRYQNELLHFLTRFLGSRAAAEDVFQETFLQVHLSIDTFDESRRFKPWLFTIAANKARDHHRKHGRRVTVSLSSSIGDEGEGQRFVDLLETHLPSPEMPVLDAERSRLVKSVVDAMPRHLREILLLSYFQKMSYSQISETLQIPLGTVKSRLHTAVATFAQAWKAARVADAEEGKS
jgi:RNA polymerase sigma-70 factor (ECF subfamily)